MDPPRKRIDTCTKTDLLVGLLLAGIVSVLLAYRIFAYLCEVTAFQWWMILLGLLCAALAIGGFLVAAGPGSACNICGTTLEIPIENSFGIFRQKGCSLLRA